MSFITAEELRAFVVRQKLDEESGVLDNIVRSSYAAMLKYTGRSCLVCPSPGNFLTETYAPSNVEMLHLMAYPIVEIGSIQEEEDTTTALTSTEYKVYAREGYLHMYGGWEAPEYYWTVKYRAGYIYGEDGSAGVGALNSLTDSTKAWGTNQWRGRMLRDADGTAFYITASTATALTVSGTPASGQYHIDGDSDWPVLRHIQLRLAAAMWKDSGFVRYVVDQNGDVASYQNDSARELDKIYTELNPYRRLTV